MYSRNTRDPPKESDQCSFILTHLIGKPGGYGVDFGFEQYELMADFMRSCKGKVMISINDHSDIRRAFDGFTMMGLDIKYSIGSTHGKPGVSKELVITNWDSAVMTQLL
ncbi:adenine modification methytransferase [Collimonas silvisoli]|uniref:adenine modification methytransferase n=1 Tax=Collimonas silvisoli TaxID=2825884 RepID=UPI001E4FB10D|nr:adenine modification methytransferase [Collimonas silvisoli]